MGRVARLKPAHLAEKLVKIRAALGLSQNQMLKILELDDKLFRSAVSGYERGTREPPLPVLLRYARVAGVCMEVLVDDRLNLPTRLPVASKHKAASH